MAKTLAAIAHLPSSTRQSGSLRDRWKRFVQVISLTGKEFIASDPLAQAAMIAYYTIFSLPAVLIITVMAAATIYDAASVRQALLDQAGGMIGKSTADGLSVMLEKAEVTETRFVMRAFGLIALVVSAGTVFASLQSSLNKVWQVEAKPGRAIWKYLGTRLLSLALVAAFGFLMLVSLALDAALVAFSAQISVWLSGAGSVVLYVFDIALSFSIITLIFAIIFKVLPDAKIKLRHVWGGALLTAALFTLGKYLIGLYVAKTHVGDTYGAASAVIIILVWVYYSTVILLFGAHYTHVRTRELDIAVQPLDHAVRTDVENHSAGLPDSAPTAGGKAVVGDAALT